MLHNYSKPLRWLLSERVLLFKKKDDEKRISQLSELIIHYQP